MIIIPYLLYAASIDRSTHIDPNHSYSPHAPHLLLLHTSTDATTSAIIYLLPIIHPSKRGITSVPHDERRRTAGPLQRHGGSSPSNPSINKAHAKLHFLLVFIRSAQERRKQQTKKEVTTSFRQSGLAPIHEAVKKRRRTRISRRINRERRKSQGMREASRSRQTHERKAKKAQAGREATW